MKSAIIVSAIIEKDGKYLFGRKPKDVGPYPNCWLIIGGRAYLEKETIEEAVRREVKEEANIEITDLEQLHFGEDYRIRKGVMSHLVFLVFSSKYKSGTPKPGDDIAELKWVSKKDCKKLKVAVPTEKLFKFLGWI
ncbi:hypothetical protein COS31_00500 [Candidatus Roizmanbacteria bacterium CG02_land_8_20_14_3_00_36_15]|uniref:Nudix hydrolase domain-containing protein n=2 Tax=Candidatus Roizmaniibacteriota TaxID=1752723 RepID=A0A2M8KJR9_9BACT|nr:MAG: hypothetical protein COS51_01060 [Candidatus Roizmanbacteria bacterium CG03_land_8_20_14_0_80_36_21]PIV38226.1 MAG: hypothetical protein COS31_00500 [Candidatus Roizmanbacteria bacterium CG02_land_8_20_14_3_00_36_15]PIY70453.1 MAG: hypothetical protein COY89_01005 [Candidatus Roizmanbacteria bacterium CG_4_10_14_0_8_um_filter_36_36]PJA53706.1 MAG: hypothetical protein CO166_00995 [Candidatus Roizmanbacteria bacterium CG_4_9_14_3_um_filter_36_11]PJC81415.1 MAG: hypothetical protein CO007